MADSVEVSTIETTDGTIGIIRDNAARQSIANLREGKETVGSVAWENVKGRPTKVSELENDKKYQTDENVSNTLNSTLYAGSSTHGGPATSAEKLTSARTISLSGAASGSGSFDGSANSTINVSSLDATKLTGVVSITNLPPSVVERMSVVKDDTERFALTKDKVQDGDVVKVQSSGLMYYVVDDDKLNAEAGYEVFKAGSAASVPWGGVTGKPSSYPPSSHTHTKSQITDFPSSMPNPNNLTMQIEGKNAAVYNGGTAQTFNITKTSLGLDKVNNTADADKSVKSAASVPWGGVTGKPSSYPPSSHTHTKDQVGLGNVVNIDQSKAIKSITRSGTTFTATALDGTTTTFTQQDNNTTYDLASQSSNGLMSAADKKAIDREFFRMLPKGGTYIPANADLNSIEYIKVGNYYNSLSIESGTIKNIPANKAFIMYVLPPLSEVYDDESTAQRVYRLRIFVGYDGKDIYVQSVFSDATPGNFSYGPWVKMTNSNDLGAVSKLINDHIANKSNPHGVTKAQVGLGNVDNTADSAKSVKYASSAGTVNGHTVNSDVPAGAVFTDHTYSAGDGLVLNGTEFETRLNNKITIDLSDSKYDQNKWYPVVGTALPETGLSWLRVACQLNTGAKVTWSSHSSGTFTANLEILTKACGWGTTDASSIVLDYSWRWTKDSVCPVSYLQMTNSSTPVFYLRGGGRYYVYASYAVNFTVYTSAYTADRQTVDVQTSCPSISFINSKVYANLGGTADSANNVAWENTNHPATFPPSAHTHTKSQITDFPSSLKNPNALSITANGTTVKYDGSSAQSISIQSGGSKSVKYTLTASKWSGSSAPYTYDLGSTYGNNSVIGFDSAVGSTAQLEAARAADIQGSSTTKIYAYGDKPTVDIPIVIIYQ